MFERYQATCRQEAKAMVRKLYLVRSAVLADFDDLVLELGGDPRPMYRSVGLTAALMSNPDHMVPCANVSTLLDVAAASTPSCRSRFNHLRRNTNARRTFVQG
jgi:hypothetical protein